MFSILIPTWDNFKFVKLCVESINKNSTYRHQVILHINEGSDETIAWAKENKIEFSFSPQNIGVCKAMNMAYKLSRYDYICYMNDDMYCCPGWDEALADEIKKSPTESFMFSATLIEPLDTGNPCVLVKDYGRDIESFKEEQLLSDYSLFKKGDWNGSTWPPNIVHRIWWDKIGGFSESFSPGMSSDDDFSMKMWEQGCRHFKGTGKGLVYHFMSKSTKRIIKNNGRLQFLQKWKIKQSTFNKYYLRRGTDFIGNLKTPSSLSYRFKLVLDNIVRITK
jgi:GT2 family glycosyltransferase